jgi:hypothetical protein
VLSGIITLGAAWYGYQRYLDSLPTPNYVNYSIRGPLPTNPEIGIPNQLTITFDKSVAKTSDLNKVIAQGVKIKPVLDGAWRWETDRQLTFKLDPNKKLDWAVGTKYEIVFEKDFFPEHVHP